MTEIPKQWNTEVKIFVQSKLLFFFKSGKLNIYVCLFRHVGAGEELDGLLKLHFFFF